MKPLGKRAKDLVWKPKLPKGMVSQEAYEGARGKAMSWKPRS